MKKIYIGAIIIAQLSPVFLGAQAGWLDPAFGTNGIEVTSVGNSNEGVYGIAIQTDGKIVTAGYSDSNVPQSFNFDFAITRHLSNGQLDTSFGSGGKVITDFGHISDFAYGVAIQSDGKIVVVGYSGDDVAVSRYLTDGSLDNTFNGNGKLVFDFSNGTDAGTGLLIQPDQKIVISGYAFTGSNTQGFVARILPGGTFDNTFGTNGRVATSVLNNYTTFSALALDASGNILACGRAGLSSAANVAVARYLPNGTLDNTFNSTGYVNTPIGTDENRGYSILVQSDGNILVGGRMWNGSNFDFSILRYQPNGTLDNTFNTTGYVNTSIGSSDETCYALALQSDGKILAVGRSYNGLDNDFVTVRYSTTGQHDLSFGTNGFLISPVGTNHDEGFVVAIQSDGKIVVGGRSSNGSNDDFTIIRYFPLSTNIENFSSATFTGLYPNPCNQSFSLLPPAGINQLFNLEVYSADGKLFFSGSQLSSSETGSISTESWPEGIYFVRISNGEKISSAKLAVSH